jgi:acyl-CoA synthetase (AMP-forming)/AMP-acid ligase II
MLIELLRRAAGEAPEQPVIISSGVPLSYEDCVARAEAVAGGLAERRIERFAVAVGDPADALVAAAASTVTGAEACLYPRELEPERAERLASSFDHEVLITAGGLDLPGRQTLPLDELALVGAGLPEPPTDFPVLILTTGTTGAQKGARHDWARLARSVRHPDERSAARWLLAYNLNQFAGIQVLLHVLVSGATVVAPPSNRPQDALATMREQGVTHVSATPTFWRLLAGRLDRESAAELAVEQITLGGEAAPESLIANLRELFPEARISHVYAGTEFGSVVSVRDGHAGLPASVLERGDDADVQFRIVDGELQIRSRVGMLGYHQGESRGEDWQPTGDLVELRDGRIHFVGRKTEIINVGGAKVHPLPIEELAARVDGVELASAYGRPNPVTGQIVALDVVVSDGIDPKAVEAGIREACEALPRAGRPRRIRFVDELETRGNKLIRGEA